MNGKGDTPRPLSIDQETFAQNWDRIFGKKTPEEDTCAYSGLTNTSSYDTNSIEAQRLEMLAKLEQISQEHGLYDTSE